MSDHPGKSVRDREDDSVSIAALAFEWVGNVRTRLALTAELVTAEAQLAALSVALMAMLGLLIGVLLLSAWGLALTGLVLGLGRIGIELAVSLPVLALIHLLFVWILWRRVLSLSHRLRFPQTKQCLAAEREQVTP